MEENNHQENTNLVENINSTQANGLTPEEPKIEEVKPQKSKKNKGKIILIIVLVLAILCGISFLIYSKLGNKKSSSTTEAKKYKSEYRMSGNSLENFDLSFLKLENVKENKIYSPLSIKYALEMLAEGTDGDSKEQLNSIIGDYKTKKYINSANMSFANAIFVKELYKSYIKEDYINKLKDTYDAEVVFDAFENVDNVNNWIKNKTLNLIDGILETFPEDPRFILINALGIDMNWEEKFILHPNVGVSEGYSHENFGWLGASNVITQKFNENQDVKGMDIIASFNNYDIVKELGEDNIRKTVGDAYRAYLLNQDNAYDAQQILGGDASEENINSVINNYLDEYIEGINKNYKKERSTTDFALYVDDNVKVFAKDLEKSGDTLLQYVGIMPTSETLDEYIKNTDSTKINTLINNLKELKRTNFKDGVVTKITGFIPKFKFEYNLDLMKDLKTLGIKDVFAPKSANLSRLTSEEKVYIEEVKHKANIEFTEDGIKAAAVTEIGGGRGAGGSFDYFYDVPVEEIDLTFNKPYMFIIRDKNTKEVWFTGTVYNPLQA